MSRACRTPCSAGMASANTPVRNTHASEVTTSACIQTSCLLYWTRALTVVPRGEKPILLCALSPRVYPWIKTVTVHETILPSPSLPGQLVKLCAEKGWSKVGMLDQAGLPNDLHTQLGAEKLALVDIPRGAFRPVATESELAMHRRGAVLAREILAGEVTRAAIGLSDYELAGR